MHAKLVSIWLACRSVFVKVMAHGVDLTLHATVSMYSIVWQLAFIIYSNTALISTQLLCVPL